MVAQKTRSAASSRRAAPRPARKAAQGSAAATQKSAPEPVLGRFAAPSVRLGMTAAEARRCSGSPDSILFGSDENVEWQYCSNGFDALGAPALYVTQLTFAAGRVIRITEKATEAR